MKAKIIKDKAEVVDALDRSINRKKRVVIFLMTKWVNKISSELVVEFSGVRYVENRVSYWFEAGYDVNTLEKSDAYPIQVGQTFKVCLLMLFRFLPFNHLITHLVNRSRAIAQFFLFVFFFVCFCFLFLLN